MCRSFPKSSTVLHLEEGEEGEEGTREGEGGGQVKYKGEEGGRERRGGEIEVRSIVQADGRPIGSDQE